MAPACSSTLDYTDLDIHISGTLADSPPPRGRRRHRRLGLHHCKTQGNGNLHFQEESMELVYLLPLVLLCEVYGQVDTQACRSIRKGHQYNGSFVPCLAVPRYHRSD
jgi:hypothetical protein